MSGRSARLLRASASLLLLASAAPAPGRAAEPAQGRVTPSQKVEWTGSFPSGGANVAGICFGLDDRPDPVLTSTAATACDVFALDVVAPAGFWDTRVGAVTVDINRYAPADTDLDLFVFERAPDGTAGKQVASSAAEPGVEESTAVPEARGGYYVAVVAFAAIPGASYHGSARIFAQEAPAPGPRVDAGPQVVTALIDTGINPYHVTFRDRSELARMHPASYIPGYPAKALPLSLSLDAPSLADALARDRKVWESARRGVLYYVPGTRIVGLISMGAGGRRCPTETDFFPANSVGNCPERILLDDHGHGTMTSSRATAATRSLGAESRVVMIEGLGAGSVRWASDQGWIDVQSNSWAEILPHPATQLFSDVNLAFKHAARRHIVFAASGNGLGGFFGFAPHDTYQLSTAAPEVILVGAHDNGKMALWSGSPPHVVTDGYAGWMAAHDSTTRFEPDSVACCTSAASPYAAGGAARLVLAARRILGSSQVGVRRQVVASGPRGRVAKGPLTDGVLTLSEIREVLLRTAESPPAEGRDDGLVHWAGDPRAPDRLNRGPGGNPYCNGCQTLPVSWRAIPSGAPSYPLIGYGAVNERSTGLAIEVLAGRADLPERPDVDAFHQTDQSIRSATSLEEDDNPEPAPSPRPEAPRSRGPRVLGTKRLPATGVGTRPVGWVLIATALLLGTALRGRARLRSP